MSNLSTVKSKVYQAAIDIHNSGRQVTRALLAERTGFKLAVVDDHVKTLCDDGDLRRTVPGILEPAKLYPANRPISMTILAEGERLLEVGDQQLRLTPGEAMVVGLALHGDAMQLAHLKGERDVYDTVQTLRAAIRRQERQLADMAQAMAKMEQRRQDDLFTTT